MPSIAAVNLGGDTDTNASIATSILGVKYPQKFIDNLAIKNIEMVNNINFKNLSLELEKIAPETTNNY